MSVSVDGEHLTKREMTVSVEGEYLIKREMTVSVRKNARAK
jgi:hypothetical protein